MVPANLFGRFTAFGGDRADVLVGGRCVRVVGDIRLVRHAPQSDGRVPTASGHVLVVQPRRVVDPVLVAPLWRRRQVTLQTLQIVLSGDRFGRQVYQKWFAVYL